MKKIEAAKDLDYYLGLPYAIILRPDGDDCLIATIEELDGCIADGPNAVEALANLKAMQRAWIESCIEARQSVPEPEPEEVLPSGKWLQRVPRSLHQRLIRLAKQEKVSLNTLVTAILSDGAASTGRHIRRLKSA